MIGVISYHYRSIPSLRDYLLIDSETILVEHYQRMGAYEWNLHEYRQLTEILNLDSIKESLTVSVFYEGVELLGSS